MGALGSCRASQTLRVWLGPDPNGELVQASAGGVTRPGVWGVLQMAGGYCRSLGREAQAQRVGAAFGRGTRAFPGSVMWVQEKRESRIRRLAASLGAGPDEPGLVVVLLLLLRLRAPEQDAGKQGKRGRRGTLGHCSNAPTCPLALARS